MTDTPEPSPSTYEVLGHLGDGGMGRVYKVRHRHLDEPRVIKMIRVEGVANPTLVRRFEREARMMSSLIHPNLARAFEWRVDGEGNSFLVMEFVDGVNLKELVADGRLPSLPLAVEIAHQALDALAFVHDQGIVHRDIAADNLMLTRDERGEPVVKLIDLGIAKAVTGDSQKLTHLGSFLGKARYTAPEQFAAGGASNLDQRSDLYSFGVVLYELLTGRCPIGGGNFSEVLSHHLFEPPLDFAESDPAGRVPAAIRQAVLGALAKEATSRVASARELQSQLDPFHRPDRLFAAELDELLEAVADTEVEVPTRPSQGSETAEVAAFVERLFRDAGVPGSVPATEAPTVRTTVPDFVLRGVPPEGSAQSGTETPRWPWLLIAIASALAVVIAWVIWSGSLR